MTSKQLIRAAATAAAIGGIVLGGLVISSSRARANDQDEENSKIQIGFQITPVPLNLAGKNRALVGLGSYIVNAQADCNGCHIAGTSTEFAPVGTHILVSRLRSIQRPSWAGAGISVPSPRKVHFHTSSRAI